MGVDPNLPSVSEVSQLHTTFYVGLASFTILVWDHLLTFSEEVEFIWKHKKGLIMYLFFINRYLTPLGFCVNLIAYFSNYFTPATCRHFVRFEGSMTLIGVNVTALMMFLRIYAIYEGRKPIVVPVAILLLVECSVNAWLLTYGIAVRHAPTIHTCTMIFDQSKVHGVFAAASAWLPLLYETVILVLTLLRTYQHAKDASAGRVMRILVKEGLLYFSVIFSITLMLTLMILLAPDGLKNVAAQTEYLLTVAMMSRITLHLKKQMHGGSPHGVLLSTSGHSPSLWSTQGADGLNIAVQQVSVMHDDHGDIVDMPTIPDFTAPSTRGQTHSRRFEWHELRPMSPLHLNISGSRRSSMSSQKQTYKRLRD